MFLFEIENTVPLGTAQASSTLYYRMYTLPFLSQMKSNQISVQLVVISNQTCYTQRLSCRPHAYSQLDNYQWATGFIHMDAFTRWHPNGLLTSGQGVVQPNHPYPNPYCESQETKYYISLLCRAEYCFFLYSCSSSRCPDL